MQILLVRHAIAEDRATFATTGMADDERPLTERGMDRMRAAAAGLAAVVDGLELIGSSPLLRARQAAHLVAERFPRAERATLDWMAPGGDRPQALGWLASGNAASVALVGHEPDLGELASWLLSGRPSPFVEFKKGVRGIEDEVNDTVHRKEPARRPEPHTDTQKVTAPKFEPPTSAPVSASATSDDDKT